VFLSGTLHAYRQALASAICQPGEPADDAKRPRASQEEAVGRTPRSIDLGRGRAMLCQPFSWSRGVSHLNCVRMAGNGGGAQGRV